MLPSARPAQSLRLAVVLWLYAIPPLETMKTFQVGWIAWLLGLNLTITVLFFGAFHLRLYVRRTQGIETVFIFIVHVDIQIADETPWR